MLILFVTFVNHQQQVLIWLPYSEQDKSSDIEQQQPFGDHKKVIHYLKCGGGLQNQREHHIFLTKYESMLPTTVSNSASGMLITAVGSIDSYFVKIIWCSRWFCNPNPMRLCLALFVVAEGWLLLDIGWFVLFWQYYTAFHRITLKTNELQSRRAKDYYTSNVRNLNYICRLW